MVRRRKESKAPGWPHLSVFIILLTALTHRTTLATDDPPWMPPSDQPEDQTPPAIQNFETAHLLQYRFPTPENPADPRDIDETNSIEYQIEYDAKIVLKRPGRETSLNYTGQHDYACRAIPEPNNNYQIQTLLTRLDMSCQAGHGSYHYQLDENGLTTKRPNNDEKHFDGSDQYYLEYSLDILNTSPGSIPIQNGVIVTPITPSPLLSTLDSDWTYHLWPMLIPPLPDSPIHSGKKWTAGSPVIIAILAEPRNMRYTVRFNGYDDETGLAEIHWTGHMKNANIEPKPGIHHIKPKMLADIEITGDLTMHVETGQIQSSRVQLNSQLNNPDPYQPDVNFSITINLQSTDKIGVGQASSLSVERASRPLTVGNLWQQAKSYQSRCGLESVSEPVAQVFNLCE